MGRRDCRELIELSRTQTEFANVYPCTEWQCLSDLLSGILAMPVKLALEIEESPSNTHLVFFPPRFELCLCLHMRAFC